MGGLNRCSEIKLGLIRRLAATTVQAEMLEARRARNVTPSLGQYLAARTAPATGDTPCMEAEGTE